MRLIRILSACILGTALLATGTPQASAIGRLRVMACQDLQSQNLGASGTRANPVACSREFSTSLPYVVLYVQIERIDSYVKFGWELRDPSDSVFARNKSEINPPAGNMWTYHLYMILPVAASEEEIVQKRPDFKYSVLEVGATPVSAMPGEWSLKAYISPGPSTTMKFTLTP